MPELRTDYLTGRSVLVAENRALRPNEFAGEPASAGGQDREDPSQHSHMPAVPHPTCPFCAGNESQTPPSVYQKLDAGGNWHVRVVPNAYPAVDNLSGLTRNQESSEDLSSTALGVHEVIIESAGHVESMSALSVAEVRDVLDAYANRLRHWRQDGRLHYGLVFKNQGPKAGASLAHIHSQLIALPVVPPSVTAELTRAILHFETTGHCAYCNLLADERSAASRIVFDRDGFVAFCPNASWQPHEVWLMPTEHAPSFELAEHSTLDGLAHALHKLFRNLQAVSPTAQFNMLLRTAPWQGDHDNTFHWRIEILPRVNAFAGFEVATAVYINPLPPERAAQSLRLASPGSIAATPTPARAIYCSHSRTPAM